jgi:hypothetical protein
MSVLEKNPIAVPAIHDGHRDSARLVDLPKELNSRAEISTQAQEQNLKLHQNPIQTDNQDSKPSVPQVRTYHPIRKFIRETMPAFAYVASSIWHVVTAGLLYFGGFSQETKAKLSQGATAFTKVVNSLVYTDLAVDAYEKKFSFDFLGRVAEPIVNLFVDLNHYHLFRAFSSAFNQLHMTNISRVKPSNNMWENFINNLQATKDIFVETWTNDLTGPNRKLFKGKNDEGHTLAFASHLQLVVGTLALLNGNKKNLTNRVLGIARNVAGLLADLGLVWEKDPAARKTGAWFFGHAIFDSMKRFMSYENQDVVDNLIMPFYNAALYNFGLTTRRQVSGEYLPQKASTALAP